MNVEMQFVDSSKNFHRYEIIGGEYLGKLYVPKTQMPKPAPKLEITIHLDASPAATA